MKMSSEPAVAILINTKINSFPRLPGRLRVFVKTEINLHKNERVAGLYSFIYKLQPCREPGDASAVTF